MSKLSIAEKISKMVFETINRSKKTDAASDLAGIDHLKDRSVGYNTPIIPQRDFANDYNLSDLSAAGLSDGDLLQKTIDGHDLKARFIAGRSRVSGADEAIGREAADRLGGAFGATIEKVPRKEIGGDAGRIYGAGSGAAKIKIDNSLGEEKGDIVKFHELSHLVDELAGRVDTKGIKKDFESLYNVQNNPFYRDGMPYKQWIKPSYDEDRELAAEAIRSYMQNPSYIKEKHPAVAARIRDTVNANPKVNDTIQFNQVAPIGAAGLLAGGGAMLSDDASAGESRSAIDTMREQRAREDYLQQIDNLNRDNKSVIEAPKSQFLEDAANLAGEYNRSRKEHLHPVLDAVLPLGEMPEDLLRKASYGDDINLRDVGGSALGVL